MPDLFRLKGESYEKEIYIFSKYTIPVQISEAASPCRRSASCFHNAVYSDVLHRYFAVHSPDDVVLWKDGILSFQTMENQPQPLTALCTPDDARDSKIIPFPTL